MILNTYTDIIKTFSHILYPFHLTADPFLRAVEVQVIIQSDIYHGGKTKKSTFSNIRDPLKMASVQGVTKK